MIYSSDNGGVGGYEREGIQGGSITDNAPLKGGKGMLYEGGVRVPYIFRWPGKIAPATISDTPIISVDLYPTLLEIAGVPPPPNYPLDGESYTPLLFQGAKGALKRDAIYWHFPGYLGAGGGTWRTTPAGAIRSGDWKLIEFFETGRLELYNLKEDIGEKNNLAAKQPEQTRALHEKLLVWRKSIGAPLPTPQTPGDGKAAGVKAKKRRQQKTGGANE
ncbi:MAG: sulfatase/phosphatase domain-containing protein [Verrucomicrobiota bacterium]